MTTSITQSSPPDLTQCQAPDNPQSNMTPRTRHEWHIAAEQAKRAYYGVRIGTYQSFAMRLPGNWKLAEYQSTATRFQEATMLKDTGHKDAAEFRLMGWTIDEAKKMEQDMTPRRTEAEILKELGY